MKSFWMALLATAAVVSWTGVSIADDWVAVKLRGGVFVWTDNAWQPLKRGDVVSDQRQIQTSGSGHVVFQRDGEVIELGVDTQIQIVDRAGQRYTTVHEHTGTVSIEAEVQNVQHFEVKTPMLAAIVKGTRFTVSTDENGSQVQVQRGHVAVEDSDTHQNVVIAAGQSASSGENSGLQVSGSGSLPAVVDANGKPVTAPSNSGNGNSGKANSGSGNSTGGNEAGKGGSANSSGGNSGRGNSGVGNGSGNNGNGNGGGNGSSAGGNSGGNGNSGNSNSGNGNSGGGSDNGNSSNSGGGNSNSGHSGGNGNGNGNGGGSNGNGNGGGNGHGNDN